MYTEIKKKRAQDRRVFYYWKMMRQYAPNQRRKYFLPFLITIPLYVF